MELPFIALKTTEVSEFGVQIVHLVDMNYLLIHVIIVSVIYLTVAGVGAICIYVSPNTSILTLLLGVVISASELAANLMMTTTMEIFPTKIR